MHASARPSVQQVFQKDLLILQCSHAHMMDSNISQEARAQKPLAPLVLTHRGTHVPLVCRLRAFGMQSRRCMQLDDLTCHARALQLRLSNITTRCVASAIIYHVTQDGDVRTRAKGACFYASKGSPTKAIRSLMCKCT